MAPKLATDAVKRGAGECLVRAVYAPNVAEPLDVQVEVVGAEVRIQKEALALGAPVHSWPDTADFGLERGIATR